MLRLDKRFQDEIIQHALEDDTIECCGVLAGSEEKFAKLFRMTNVDNSAYRFSWDSKELISVWREMESNDWEHRAVYHSHTHSEAYPSGNGHPTGRVARGLLRNCVPHGQGQPPPEGVPNRRRRGVRGTYRGRLVGSGLPGQAPTFSFLLGGLRRSSKLGRQERVLYGQPFYLLAMP